MTPMTEGSGESRPRAAGQGSLGNLGSSVDGTVNGGSVTAGSGGGGGALGTIEVVDGELGLAGTSPAVEAPPPPAAAFPLPVAAVVRVVTAPPAPPAAVDVEVVGGLGVGAGVWLPERR
jgi:hypothetical protein